MSRLEDWIGKTEEKLDHISETLAQRMAALLAVEAPKSGEPLPHLWHWMFFQPALPASELGRDGHPALGGFMPPASGRNRMWAGGSFEFNRPFIIGCEAKCISTVENVVEKEGRTGSLVFVTVKHEYIQDNQNCFCERQTIVYREPSSPKTESDPAPSGEWTKTVNPDATLLFRYSAVTYNGHRIHYDYPYVTETEGYTNLVVHGPMMATWGLNGFIEAHPDKEIVSYEFRGVRPTTIPTPINISGRIVDDNCAEVWLANEMGVIQRGKVTFK